MNPARDHLCAIDRGALSDERVCVLHEDGARFVRNTSDSYDLVLLDLTDPETPAGPLYTGEFFEDLREVMRPGGMVVLHLGAPFFEPDQVRSLTATLRERFERVDVFGLHVPLYGAYWGFAVASEGQGPTALDAAEVRRRLLARGIERLGYYNADVHGALFALPNFFADLVAPAPGPALPPSPRATRAEPAGA